MCSTQVIGHLVKTNLMKKMIQKTFREYLNNTRENCAICLYFIPKIIEPYIESNDENDLNNKPCHNFHKKCLCNWISRGNNTCPTCRGQITDKNLNNLFTRKIKLDLLNTLSYENIEALYDSVKYKRDQALIIKLELLSSHIYFTYYDILLTMDYEEQNEYINEKCSNFINGPIINNYSPLHNLIMKLEPDLAFKCDLINMTEFACITFFKAYSCIDDVTLHELQHSINFLTIELQNILRMISSSLN